MPRRAERHRRRAVDLIATALPLVLADLGNPVAETDVTCRADGDPVAVTVHLPEGDVGFGVPLDEEPAARDIEGEACWVC